MRWKNNIISVINKALEWCVYLTFLLLPVSKSMIEICVSVGFVLVVAKRAILKNFRLPKTPAGLALLFVFLTAAVSLFNTPWFSLSLRAVISKNLKFIFLYFLVVEAIDDRTKLANLLKMILISAVVMITDTFIQYFLTHYDVLHSYPSYKYFDDRPIGGFYEVGYPTGPFPFPNDLAAWLLIVIPLALSMSISGLKDGLSRCGVGLVSAAGLYIFVLTKARGAWIGFAVSMAMMILLVKKKVVILLILVAVAVLAVFCFFNSPHVITGFSSMADRTEMWTVGVSIFKEHPIIGNGINTFFNKFKEARRDQDKGLKGSYAHNCYLQMASDVGVLGLGAFLWFVVSVFVDAALFLRRTAGRFYHSLVLGLVIGISAFLVHSFFDTNLYSLNLAGLFWGSTGLLTAAVKIADSPEAMP